MKINPKSVESGTKNLMKTNLNSDIQRSRRMRQLAKEEELSKSLRKDGWEVFSPTVVCDRIGIKNNKVCFIEFKKKGQDLRENQNKVKKLVNNYLIVYY